MASKQRSFFDQRSVKRKPWNGARKPTHVNQGLDPPPKTMPAPLIAASSNSRSKLKTFEFVKSAEVPGDTRSGENDKENLGSTKDPARPSTSQKSPRSSLQSQPKSTRIERREHPQTPVGRVPLSELISTGDESFDMGPSLTPVERILWNHSPHSSDPTSSMMTPAIRRGKKRARSSSVNSSSQNEASNHFPLPRSKTSFDLQTLQTTLKTPHADPAGDLWSRYSLNTTDRHTPNGTSGPTMAKLLNSSSPQTPAGHLLNNDGGLRRSISCGMEWPTSAAKRRKIRKSCSQVVTKNDFIAEGAVAAADSSKASRMSILLEKIQDSLNKPTTGVDSPVHPSSSPLPPNAVSRLPSKASELPRLDAVVRQNSPSSDDRTVDTEIVPVSRVSQRGISIAKDEGHVVDKDSSSEFGDDEIDLDLFDEVDASMQTMRLPSPTTKAKPSNVHRNSNSSNGNTKPPNIHPSSSGPAEPRKLGYGNTANAHNQVRLARNDVQHVKKSPPPNATDEFDDDFDDDDTELFAASVEGVVAVHAPLPVPNGMASVGISSKCIAKQDSNLAGNTQKGHGVAKASKNKNYVEVSSDNEFGDDLDFEEIAVEYASATQAAKMAEPGPPSDKHPLNIQRYLIMQVVEGRYQTDRGFNRPEKVLLVQEERTKLQKAVTLRQCWYDSACIPGSYVHIVGKFDKAGQCIVDDAQNMLILHPDHLISATVVADSSSCIRRAVLQDRVKATNEANEPQIYGHILHEIFQEAMKANRWDSEWLARIIATIASRYLENLFEINVEMTRAVEHLMSKVPELQSWAELFVTARPKADAIVKDQNGTKALMSVNKLLDVEEHVWSPMYGLKGNIDATVQVVMKDGNEEKTLTVPFEVKTGKNFSNVAHRAQTALYTLLLSDRYDVQITYGILYYMETSEVSRIAGDELRHMIMQRNELASYVRQRLELPPMKKSPHLCGKCYAQTSCFVYHKLVDDGDGETSRMKEKFDEVVQHLKPIHQEFFKKWDDLLTKEETDVLKFRRELWTMLSTEREKVGRCFGNVVIEPGSACELTDVPKINRFRYTFIKPKAPSSFSFVESQITVGEPIVISDEKGHFALANGYVTKVQKRRITVTVDRRLHNARVRSKSFDAEKHQSFAGIMEIVEDGKDDTTRILKAPEEQVLYRLDKDEFSNGMATVRNNLIRVMEKDLFGSQALRKLIIEGVPPTFGSVPPSTNGPKSGSQASLNVDQRNAIERVMTAKDYALVLGMPGTGKTTTIAHIIRALAAQGKSILLTSYTHTAVDNILLKIRNDGIGILRLGAVAKVHPEVQGFADLAGIPKTTVEELKESYSKQVVATTCLGINHPIFNQRIFDYCIVDEASQITLPVCLGPIRMARTFILVGDHYQLPPLVQNKEAQEGGLDISLFKLLSDKHPSSVVNLEHQYRMCSEIMSLSNTLIYSGRLKCGTPAVATRSITIPNMAALKFHHHSSTTLLALSQRSICPNPIKGPCWLRSLLDPATKVAFINTDPLLPLAREIAHGSRITNPVEAALTTQLVESLVTVGVQPVDIGVITLYRSQLSLLKQNLRHRCSQSPTSSSQAGGALEMHTADRFQGRDKDVVVLSLVRSNEAGNVGDLLKDWRRLNVALTRARTKLLILGSAATVRRGNELLGRFLDLVEARGWLVGAEKGWLESHVFEERGTQGTGRVGCAGRDEEVDGKLGGLGEMVDVEGDVEVREEVKVTALGKENRKRIPQKSKSLDIKALLGKRPVLRDIVNDSTG